MNINRFCRRDYVYGLVELDCCSFVVKRRRDGSCTFILVLRDFCCPFFGSQCIILFSSTTHSIVCIKHAWFDTITLVRRVAHYDIHVRSSLFDWVPYLNVISKQTSQTLRTQRSVYQHWSKSSLYHYRQLDNGKFLPNRVSGSTPAVLLDRGTTLEMHWLVLFGKFCWYHLNLW